jgi:hypothetical protein
LFETFGGDAPDFMLSCAWNALGELFAVDEPVRLRITAHHSGGQE